MQRTVVKTEVRMGSGRVEYEEKQKNSHVTMREKKPNKRMKWMHRRAA